MPNAKQKPIGKQKVHSYPGRPVFETTGRFDNHMLCLVIKIFDLITGVNVIEYIYAVINTILRKIVFLRRNKYEFTKNRKKQCYESLLRRNKYDFTV